MPAQLNPKKGLVALQALGKVEFSNPEQLPTRLVVFPWGEHETAKGKFRVGDVTLSAMPNNQTATNFDRVPLDFSHNTVPGSEHYKGEPAAVAAYGVPKVIDGEGIVLEAIEWTDKGKEMIAGGHYRDLSPCVKQDADGNVIFLHSVAACRVGCVPGLILFSADSPENSDPKMIDHKKLLCATLGLTEDATDEDITKAAEALVRKEGGGETPEMKALMASITAITQTVTTLSANVKALSDGQVNADREAVTRQAAAEGKVIPKAFLEGDTALTVPQLRALCATLPVTVPLEQRTPSGLTSLSAEHQPSAADEAVRQGLGISVEDWKKYAA